jgi:YVTN family beta-propeller protein
MRLSRTLVGLLAALLSAIAVGGQASTSSLLVLAKNDQTMAVVDPVSLQVIWTVAAGPDPHEVIASPDGSVAYIANYGRGTYNTLTVIDLVNRRALAPVDLGALRGPHGLAYAGGRVWFTSETAKVIAGYDPIARKVDSIVGLGQNRTHMLLVSDDLQRMIASNVNSDTISIVERAAAGRAGGAGARRGGPQADLAGAARGGAAPLEWNHTAVTVGDGPEGFDLSPDGQELWVGNAQDGTVSIIDMSTKAVKETVAASVPGANRLKFARDGSRVFVSMLNNPDVVVIDVATRKEIRRVAIGSGGAGLLVQPDGARVFAAASPDGTVAVIDTSTLEVVGRIPTGRGPDGLAWAVR